MKIYKFGGASIKDAASIHNVVQVIQTMGYNQLGIVISAMGKTTNKLEQIIDAYLLSDHGYIQLIDDLFQYHLQVVTDLESGITDQAVLLRFRESVITTTINDYKTSLLGLLDRNTSNNHAFVYDQVVCYGELLSSQIVAAYLNANGVETQWLDARQLIKTNQKYRDAAIDWDATQQLINSNCSSNLFLTQGFIGADPYGFTTTLGREGSDYTAAILAYSLEASHVTIWKDVPGVLNADPRVFNDTVLLEQISYREAIELAYYGASVIHPKTLQPLQKKSIELRVKSFINPNQPGTVITNGPALYPMLPCYIVRNNLVFMQISSRDFSFIGEHNISEIFHQLSEHKMQVGLMQNSAISFTLCIEDKYRMIDQLKQHLDQRYNITIVTGVTLYTIRHHSDNSIDGIERGKQVLLRQRTQETLQMVVVD